MFLFFSSLDEYGREWRVLTNVIHTRSRSTSWIVSEQCLFLCDNPPFVPHKSFQSQNRIDSRFLPHTENQKKIYSNFWCRFLQLALLNWCLSAICVICNLLPTYFCCMHKSCNVRNNVFFSTRTFFVQCTLLFLISFFFVFQRLAKQLLIVRLA